MTSVGSVNNPHFPERQLNIYITAIWDNRCTFHTATHDYDGLGERAGHRAVGIAEVPYLDPHSESRSEALLKA